MTKTTTVTTTYTDDRCYRYPCNHAYRQQQHVVNNDGHVIHLCDAIGGPQWIDVGIVAIDEGPWRVALRIEDEGWRLIEDDGRYENIRRRTENAMEEALDLAKAITTSVGRMAGTWLYAYDDDLIPVDERDDEESESDD
jgi:hypothetical protein